MACRSVVVAGASYSGSTQFGLLMGAMPGVFFAGETHWLVNRRVEGNWDQIVKIDDCRSISQADTRRGIYFCDHDGASCPIWTNQVRNNLLRSNSWFMDLKSRVTQFIPETKVVLSIDKNLSALGSISAHDFDFTIILYRTISHFIFSYFRRDSSIKSSREVVEKIIDLSEQWCFLYNSWIKHLESKNIPFIVVDYNRLLLSADSYLEEICNRINIDYSPIWRNYAERPHHYIGGNFSLVQRRASGERIELGRPEILPSSAATMLEALIPSHHRSFEAELTSRDIMCAKESG